MIPLWGLWAIVTGMAGFGIGSFCFWESIRLRIRRYRVQREMDRSIHEWTGGLL